MKTPICHLVGAGSFCKELFCPQEEDFVIACDGGLAHLLKNGYLPHLAIGDFDSFSGTPTDFLPEDRIVFLPKEKDDTDCLFALKTGLSKGYRRFLLHGSLGGDRLSHTLANLSLLSFLEQNGAKGTLVGQNVLVFRMEKGQLSFKEDAKGYLSVFADEGQAKVTLKGLKYPFSGILYAHTPLGVSNEFAGTAASVSVEEGSILVVAEGQCDPMLFFEDQKQRDEK